MAEVDSESGDNRYVSTKHVASALGVSVSTVKRWVDDGVLPAQRTRGGHRKLLMSEVVRFIREGDYPRADLCQLIPKPLQSDAEAATVLREQLIEALLSSDSEVVRSLLQGAFRNGYALEALADQVIAPAMARLGHDWESGAIEVFHEHRATQTVLAALYELEARQRPAARGAPVAIGGAPEHDHSIVPTLLAKMVLNDCGWNAINLGPHTPVSALMNALNEFQPKLIWLSISHLVEPDQFIDDFAKLCRRAEQVGTPVAIGGSCLTDTLRRRLTYTTFGDGLRHLAAFAKTLHPGPNAPRRGRPPRPSR